METLTLHHKKALQLQTISQPKWERIALLSILGYEAAGGISGGALLAAAPDGHLMDMPVDMMHGVFSDFLVPGIILLGMGILTAFSFVSVFRRSPVDWLMASIALGGWAIWFTVEIAILQGLHWLHFMWGYPVFLGIVAVIPLIALRNNPAVIQRNLLICGALSSLWYVAINIYVPLLDKEHNVITQVVSELSAIGAPTRIIWILLATLYPILYAAFGWGILQSAEGNRSLRIIGILILVYSVITFYWPPMHTRGSEMTLTDILHITWGMVTLVFNLAILGYGIATFRKGFRIYSIVTLVLFIVSGIFIGTGGMNLAVNEPTPMLGVWERTNIAIFMVWIAALAIKIMRKEKTPEPASSGSILFI